MNFHYSEQQAASYLGVFCVFEWRKVQSASNEEAMRLKLHLFVGKWIAESYAPLCNVQYTTIILQFGGKKHAQLLFLFVNWSAKCNIHSNKHSFSWNFHLFVVSHKKYAFLTRCHSRSCICIHPFVFSWE